MTAFFERLLQLVFGKGTVFEVDGTRELEYGTGRLLVLTSWVEYRRWGGLFRGFIRLDGVLRVTMAYNPGLPQFIFEAACVVETIPELIQISVEDVIREYSDVDGAEESAALPSDPVCWRCDTIVRTAADLMDLHRWLEIIRAGLDGDEDETDAPFTEDEDDMVRDVMTLLTERFTECRLNS